jgi:nucleotide sugar dehydrogenase
MSGKSTTFTVLSNPEFLSQGSAIVNTLSPSKLLIGTLDSRPNSRHMKAAEVLSELYSSWISPQKIHIVPALQAELHKLLANTLLAQRLATVNVVEATAAMYGLDFAETASLLEIDTRSGFSASDMYLRPGLGFGGSCLEKDLIALSNTAIEKGVDDVSGYWAMIKTQNNAQILRMIKRMECVFSSRSLCGKQIAILGAAYKNSTADVRNSPAIRLAAELWRRGSFVRIYDPQATESAIHDEVKKVLGTTLLSGVRVKVCTSATKACERAQIAIVATDWDHFKMTSPSTFIDDSFHSAGSQSAFSAWPEASNIEQPDTSLLALEQVLRDDSTLTNAARKMAKMLTPPVGMMSPCSIEIQRGIDRISLPSLKLGEYHSSFSADGHESSGGDSAYLSAYPTPAALSPSFTTNGQTGTFGSGSPERAEPLETSTGLNIKIENDDEFPPSPLPGIIQRVHWRRIANGMSEPKWIFDARGVVNAEALRELGCKVWRIGHEGTNDVVQSWI